MTTNSNPKPPTAAPDSVGTLYVVATPIGNLGDISMRAIEILQSVDTIVCEDTRVTSKILQRFNIKKRLINYDEHSHNTQTAIVQKELQVGKYVALVTDAGTPGLADPGQRLIAAIRQQIPSVHIVPIPGPNAAIAALSVSGFPSDTYIFLGFPPHKKGRQTFFRQLTNYQLTVVLYESPHRILKTLTALQETVPDRQLLVARELTKLHEDIQTGTAAELLDYFQNNPKTVRGEFVIVVS